MRLVFRLSSGNSSLSPQTVLLKHSSVNKLNIYCSFKKGQAIWKKKLKRQGKNAVGVTGRMCHRSICSHKVCKKYSNDYSILLSIAESESSFKCTQSTGLCCWIKTTHLLHKLHRDTRNLTEASAPMHACSRLYLIQTCHFFYAVIFLPSNYITKAHRERTSTQSTLSFHFLPHCKNASIWDDLSDWILQY